MAFGWSFPKLMLLITVGVLLFGMPLMTFVVILKERYEKRTRKNGRNGDRRS